MQGPIAWDPRPRYGIGLLNLRFACGERRLHRADKAIPTAGKRLDICRRIRTVAESAADLVDREVETALEIDHGLVGPRFPRGSLPW